MGLTVKHLTLIPWKQRLVIEKLIQFLLLFCNNKWATDILVRTLTLLRGPYIGSIDRLHHILVAVIHIAIMIIHVILTCPYFGCLIEIHAEAVVQR